MRRLPPVVGLTLAAICLIAAAWIVAAAGLPQRAAFTGIIAPDGQIAAPEIGAIAPPFTAQTAQGHTLRLADLRGSPVILNFWATWCEPCRFEMPILQTLYAAYRDRGLRLLAINLGESPEQILRWFQTLGLDFDALLDPDGVLAARYHLRGQPSTIIIAPNGVITHILYGPADHAALEAAVRPLLPD
jgi:peroxiredoxin